MDKTSNLASLVLGTEAALVSCERRRNSHANIADNLDIARMTAASAGGLSLLALATHPVAVTGFAVLCAASYRSFRDRAGPMHAEARRCDLLSEEFRKLKRDLRKNGKCASHTELEGYRRRLAGCTDQLCHGPVHADSPGPATMPLPPH